MTTFAFAHFETSSKFYNASNVAIPLQDVLEARAFSEIAADADLLRGETLGLREYLRRQAPGNHDDASFGVALFPRHAGETDSLLAKADEALYRAKAAGRDRVVVSDAAAASRSDTGATTHASSGIP